MKIARFKIRILRIDEYIACQTSIHLNQKYEPKSKNIIHKTTDEIYELNLKQFLLLIFYNSDNHETQIRK